MMVVHSSVFRRVQSESTTDGERGEETIDAHVSSKTENRQGD
jgi:hypothetical protein